MAGKRSLRELHSMALLLYWQLKLMAYAMQYISRYWKHHYNIISSQFVLKHQIERIEIRPNPYADLLDPKRIRLRSSSFFIGCWRKLQPCVYAYVVPKLDGHDMILGLPG